MEENLIEAGEVKQNRLFTLKMMSFKKCVESTSEMLETFFGRYNYDELALADKIRYTLFVVFAITTYFWMYLRLRGVDPTQHEIQQQIERLRKYMNKSKHLHEKKTRMPRIDQHAAKRFVRSGLWTSENSHKTKSDSSKPEGEVPLKRKKKNSDG